VAEWGVLLVASASFGERALMEWQLARALGRRRPVLYVDPPTFVHRAVRPGSGRRPWPALRHEAGVHVLRPVATPGADRAGWARIADRAIALQIESAARRFLPGRRALLQVDPRRGTLPGVSRDLFVYMQRDAVTASAAVRDPDHLLARHEELLDHADLVTGVSPGLLDGIEGTRARTLLLPNGCDVDHFTRPHAPPPELAGDEVVVGFAGGLTWRVDFELLAAVAEARPDWRLALVGEGPAAEPGPPNLVRFGAKPYAELPAWVQRFDVALIPYRQEPFNLASFPLKVFEYLAAGTPVVSTPLPALEGMAPFVRIAADAEQYVAAVDEALTAGPSAEECRELGRANSWDHRAAELEAVLSDLLTTPRVAP
jgi:teichuronic acid biosynthesis glycosyltransferase TuaH